MRLPDATFRARPWRIHELTQDFRLEDVWALHTPGGPHDLGRLVAGLTAGRPGRGGSWPVRTLWALRLRLGELLHWDDPDKGLDGRFATSSSIRRCCARSSASGAVATGEPSLLRPDKVAPSQADNDEEPDGDQRDSGD